MVSSVLITCISSLHHDVVTDIYSYPFKQA